jgi:4-hydroxy-tetrahydrodipicolinate synthase
MKSKLYYFGVLVYCVYVQSFIRLNENKLPLNHLHMLQVGGGSIVALVTPMGNDRQIDYNKLTELLKWHKSAGTDGVVMLGTTGEGSTISMLEREQIIKSAVLTINKAFPVIVGTGTIDAENVIELSKQALDCGADASLVITPYYVKPPQRALVEHYKRIADAVALPMIVYNCPGRTGVDLKPATVAQFSSHPNVIFLRILYNF